MPGPGGFGGRGFGGGFGGRGFGGRGFGGPGFRFGGRGWGPRFPGLGLVGAVATGAAIASLVGPPPHRRFPPPPAGYIYVVEQGHAPRAVRAEEAPFIITRVNVASYRTTEAGEVLFEVQVTINDGFKYGVLRRYSQFDDLRARVAHVIRTVTPPFPPKHSMRSAFVGFGAADLEDRRQMLQAWLQSLCTAASTSTKALRVPLYDFLQTASYYPPDETASPSSAQPNFSDAAASTAVATPMSSGTHKGVPVATATPYAETFNPPPAVPMMAKPDPAGDGWAIPPESQSASDLKMAMVGPDPSGRLTGPKAAEALRSGTGASAADLRAVWELSDIDRDGMLDRDEFALAWYLAHQAAAGNKPPSSLSGDIVPPSKRHLAARSSANPF